MCQRYLRNREASKKTCTKYTEDIRTVNVVDINSTLQDDRKLSQTNALVLRP